MKPKLDENHTQKLNAVWAYVFVHTMRERATLPGDANHPNCRFSVAVHEADRAVSDPKTLDSWWSGMGEDS